MKTCTRCGQDWGDDLERCPEDGAPLQAAGDDDAVMASRISKRLEIPLGPEDPATVVRARPAVPIPPASFSPTPARVAAPSVQRRRAPAPAVAVSDARSLWPVIAALSLIAICAIGALAYYLVSQQSTTAATIGAQISDARVAVAEARARIENLPVEHALRRNILNLDKWDRELQGFETSRDRTAQMASRARELASQARDLGDQARAAGAPAPLTPPVPPPATPQPTPAGGDPMAPGTVEKPIEKPVERPVEKPAEPKGGEKDPGTAEPPKTEPVVTRPPSTTTPAGVPSGQPTEGPPPVKSDPSPPVPVPPPVNPPAQFGA